MNVWLQHGFYRLTASTATFSTHHGHDRSSQLHSSELFIQIFSMRHAADSLMIVSTYVSPTLGAKRLLHRHTAFTNSESMAVLASVPMSEQVSM